MSKAKLTPEGWRCDKEKDHLLRAKWLDFRSPAIHQLTMVSTDRSPLFGKLIVPDNDTNLAFIERTPLGDKIAEEIERIPTYIGASSIEIYTYIVMPDHIHVLLQVHDRLPKHLGQYVRWFKRQCTSVGLTLGATSPNSPSAGLTLGATSPSSPSAGLTLGAISPNSPSAGLTLGAISPSSPSAGLTLGAISPSKDPWPFAPEYHDRVLTHKGQLANMKNYILDNPRRLALKRANPDLFRLHRQTLVGGIACTTLGNIFLADYPQRAVLQCSRSLTPTDIAALRDECLAEATNGTIYITAAISEGEKTIARTLREAGFPLIILLENGFPRPDDPHYKYFKPQGIYFEACAAGRLLLVEPSPTLLDRPDIAAQVSTKAGDLSHTSKRYRFLALNAIAAEIAR